MDNQNREQLYKYFHDSIRKDADVKIKALREEIDAMRHEAEVMFENALKEDQTHAVNTAKEDISHEFQMRLTAKKYELDLTVKEKRQKLLDELLVQLNERLISFRESKQYGLWIKDKLKLIAIDEYDKMEIDENDQTLASYKYDGQKIMTSGLLAGFILHHHDGNSLIDESFKTKIEEVKLWFYANSGWFSEPEDNQ